MKKILFIITFLSSLATWSQEKLWTEAEREFLITDLSRSLEDIIQAVNDLSEAQWRFKESEDRWSVADIVEHLEVQDEMFYREMDVIPKRPETPEFAAMVKGNDSLLLAYATDPTKGFAGYLEPIGRFCSKKDAITAFSRIRNMMLEIVKNTDEDLRLHFTFRSYADDGGLTDPGIYDVRDLHQLMLTCIAHTDRHRVQIENLMKHQQYPSK